jgi:hypothetical protein
MITDTEVLKAETLQAVIALETIATADYPITSFGDAYKQVGLNFSLDACELAALITGRDSFFARMMNYKFRTDAGALMFDRAMSELTA